MPAFSPWTPLPAGWLCETRPDWTPVAGWVLPHSRFLNDVHRLALPALRWEGVATTGAVPRPRCQAAAAVSADGVCVLESAAAGCLARAHTGCWGVGACLLVYGGAAHAAGPHEHLCYGAKPRPHWSRGRAGRPSGVCVRAGDRVDDLCDMRLLHLPTGTWLPHDDANGHIWRPQRGGTNAAVWALPAVSDDGVEGGGGRGSLLLFGGMNSAPGAHTPDFVAVASLVEGFA